MLDRARGNDLGQVPPVVGRGVDVGRRLESRLAHRAANGLGIRVRPVRHGANLFHTGSIPGTSTLAVRSADGFAWVVAFNSRPQDRNGFRGELDRGLWAAKGKVKTWPDGNLFDRNP